MKALGLFLFLSFNILGHELSIQELKNIRDLTQFAMQHSSPVIEDSGITFKECRMKALYVDQAFITAQISHSSNKIFEYKVIPQRFDFNIHFGAHLMRHLILNGLCEKETPREKLKLFFDVKEKEVILNSTNDQLITMAKKKAPLMIFGDYMFAGLYYKSCRFLYTRNAHSGSSRRMDQPDYGTNSARIDLNGLVINSIEYKSDARLQELTDFFKELVKNDKCK